MADIPQSRTEEILYATINGEEYTGLPESRIEELLLELKEVIEEGGGGGGTSTIAWKPTVAADGTISWVRTASETKPEDQNIKGPDGDPGLGIKLVSINEQGHLIITYDDDTTQDAGAIPGGGGVVDPPVINLEGIASENDVNTKSATFTAANTATYLLIEIIAGDTFPVITSFSATVNGDDVNLNEYYSDSAHINSKYAILNLEAGDVVVASVISSIAAYGTSASIMFVKLSSPIQNLVLKASDARTSGECAVDFNADKDGFYLLFFLDRREGSINFNTIKLNDETITKNRIICSVSDGWEVRHGMCIASAKALDNFKVSIQARGYADAVGIFYVETGGSGGGSAELTDDLTASVTVGGITSGTTYEEGTSLEDILRDMLDPIAYPTLTNPSVNLSGSGSKLLEIGSTLAVTLTATFSRGSINPAYGTSGYRSGAVTGYSLNGGTVQSENTWSETVSESNKTFKCSATYAAGEQPKDSKGNNYSSPLPAGSVESGNVVYKFDHAMWANTAAIGTIAKLSLIDHTSTKQRDMVFPAQTVANPEVFDIPAAWNVTAVQVKNDLSGQFEDATDQFTVSSTTHNDAAENSVNYNRYTFNKGFDTGARTVRVKWS